VKNDRLCLLPVLAVAAMAAGMSASCSVAGVGTVAEPGRVECSGRSIASDVATTGRAAEGVLRDEGFHAAAVGTAVRASRRLEDRESGHMRVFDRNWTIAEASDATSRPVGYRTLRVQLDLTPNGGGSCMDARLEAVGFSLSEPTRSALAKALFDAVEAGLVPSKSDVLDAGPANGQHSGAHALPQR